MSDGKPVSTFPDIAIEERRYLKRSDKASARRAYDENRVEDIVKAAQACDRRVLPRRNLTKAGQARPP
jgi:hypothetical protein